MTAKPLTSRERFARTFAHQPGDRVPIIMIAGVGDTAVPAHTAVDLATTVREYVKWDHQPTTLAGVGQALIRAYKLATTPPMAANRSLFSSSP